MSKINSLIAREIIDSRGNPTIEVSCEFESGAIGLASVPSGVSTGVHEAFELRDRDDKRYHGLGVLKAVENVNGEINKYVQHKDYDQKTIDETLIALDGTKNKSRLGTNAILGVSLAFARASAREGNLELYQYLGGLVGNDDFMLPQPMFNIINGGKHADSGLDVQEFMLAPVGFDSFHRKVQVASEIIFSLKKILGSKGCATSVGDEGGFAPKLSRNEEAFELIVQAILDAGYTKDNVKIAIDVAASSFYKSDFYALKIDGEVRAVDIQGMIDWYQKLIANYPIVSIEDGFAEDDWQGFSGMFKKLGDKITIVGDDLTVTNSARINLAVEKKAINSVLIKLNQIGTLTETIDAIQLTKKQG